MSIYYHNSYMVGLYHTSFPYLLPKFFLSHCASSVLYVNDKGIIFLYDYPYPIRNIFLIVEFSLYLNR